MQLTTITVNNTKQSQQEHHNLCSSLDVLYIQGRRQSQRYSLTKNRV
jgi:hypothetical protein